MNIDLSKFKPSRTIQVIPKEELKKPLIESLYEHDEDEYSKGKLILCRSGIHIFTTDTQIIRDLKSMFTIRTLMNRSRNFYKTICAARYNATRKTISLPRFGFLGSVNSRLLRRLYFDNPKVVNKITAGELKYSKLEEYAEWDAELGENQAIVTKWLMKNVFTSSNKRAGIAGCVLKMPTGTGKTYMGASIIHELGGPVLIICQDTGDLKQWRKTLKSVFPDITIGQLDGTDKADGDIIVAVINSLNTDEFKLRRPGISGIRTYDSINFFARFKLMIFDECHCYCTKSGLELFRRAQAPYMLGLTATPDSRPDKFDPVAHWFIGPVVDSLQIPGYQHDDVKYTCKTEIIQYVGPPEFTQQLKNAGSDDTSVTLMIKQFASDPYRLSLVCRKIRELYDDDHYVLIFADRKEYLMTIQAGLLSHIPEREMDLLAGGANDEKFTRVMDKSRVILTTYAYFGRGKSNAKLTALVMVTPRKSHIQQLIGRIFRKGSDSTIERRIVDIVDYATTLKSQASQRKQTYNAQSEIGREFSIVTEKIKWDSIKPRYAGNIVKVEKTKKKLTDEQLAHVKNL